MYDCKTIRHNFAISLRYYYYADSRQVMFLAATVRRWIPFRFAACREHVRSDGWRVGLLYWPFYRC